MINFDRALKRTTIAPWASSYRLINPGVGYPARTGLERCPDYVKIDRHLPRHPPDTGNASSSAHPGGPSGHRQAINLFENSRCFSERRTRDRFGRPLNTRGDDVQQMLFFARRPQPVFPRRARRPACVLLGITRIDARTSTQWEIFRRQANLNSWRSSTEGKASPSVLRPSPLTDRLYPAFACGPALSRKFD